jgi:hypothetical protein
VQDVDLTGTSRQPRRHRSNKGGFRCRYLDEIETLLAKEAIELNQRSQVLPWSDRPRKRKGLQPYAPGNDRVVVLGRRTADRDFEAMSRQVLEPARVQNLN